MLEFNEQNHEYKLDGEVIPSVTQVLRSAGIIDHKFTAPGAMEKGTDAHQAIEFWNQGDLDEDALADDLRGYLEAWKKFVGDYGLRVQLTEIRVCHKRMKYAGTVDYIGRSTNTGDRYLVDYKTGEAQPWHALQIAAYMECVAKERLDRTKDHSCIIVYLKKDGTYKAPKVDLTNAWAVFQSALNIFNWKSGS